MRNIPPTLRRLLLTVLAVGLLASACGDDDPTTTAPVPAGDDATDDGAPSSDWPHDFTAPLIGGGTIDAGDYEGQDLVLWFWAPW